MKAPRSRAALLSRGHTSAFHTATASSSRSMAWRTGTWADQPCRRISFQVPSTVYPTWNSLPISVLIRPSVQRWSPANPCASGPFVSSASSRAHCCGLSRSRDTGPLDRSASGSAVLPGPVPPPHRPFGDPHVVRDLRDRVAAGEPPGGLQPQPLTPLLLGGRIPAPLRIPHALVIRPQPADVTTRALRVNPV